MKTSSIQRVVADESTCKPGSVLDSPCGTRRATAIHLGLLSPTTSCGLPADSGEQPSNVCAVPVETGTS
jgi:hypothetical protein